MQLNFLSRLFGVSKPDFKELVKNGAFLLDVRTTGEFSRGHVPGAKNIPMDQLRSKISSLPKDKVIICYCASGVRSASAKGVLMAKGFKEVYNGGGCSALMRKLS